MCLRDKAVNIQIKAFLFSFLLTITGKKNAVKLWAYMNKLMAFTSHNPLVSSKEIKLLFVIQDHYLNDRNNILTSPDVTFDPSL